MGIFGRRTSGRSSTPDGVEASLPDGEWFGASRRLYEQRVKHFYGSPETMASGGAEFYGNGDFGTAMFFYAKSIDMLHTAYGFAQMAQRQPSPADVTIVDGFCNSLGVSLQMHPAAPVDECVREVTHRLRSISSECDRVGLPSNLYRQGLDAMASHAPNVRIDDILWT